jgi:protein-tyrosine phosphatase
LIATEVARGREESRPVMLAVLWLAALGPFFFVTYNFANWFTGLRQHVPSLAFGWERHIPFLAWTIVPYWSTDAFYTVSLFLCRSKSELLTLVKRLFATQVLCVCGFLIAPLRFGFDRPHADGLFGRMFDALMTFDRPFNQAPSLHVALTAVLWVTYGRHFRGVVLWVIRAWFVAMALSTLTTYQHHFIDVPTGLWVGLFVLMLFPGDAPKSHALSRDPQRFRLAAVYLIGALAFGVAAWMIGGAAWLLLWPAGALAIVAGIYVAGRPELFRKSDGGVSWASTMVLAPYLLGAWLNSRWWTRGQPAAQEIAAGVWLGRIPRRSEREALGFASIVDLTAELPIGTRGIDYRAVPVLDLLPPTADQIDAAIAAITDLEQQRPTLVCCALGYARSAAAVAAWLLATQKATTVNEAIEMIRARRPSIALSPRFHLVLAQWAETRRLA